MNRMITTNWRGQTDWNPELESGAPVHRFTAAARPIDLLDEETAADRPTPTVLSVDAFDAGEQTGRYHSPSEGAVRVVEASSVPGAFESGFVTRFYDPALDEFFVGWRFGDSHDHGSFGSGRSGLFAPDGESDDVIVGPVSEAEPHGDAFITLPHDEALALRADAGLEVFGDHTGDVTFGGGDDPLWMLTLLPSPEDHVHDTGFGHPGLGIDPWG
ncbi:MAG: hypothetical protein ACXW3O_08235 [Brevundimonas sp.]